MAIEGGEIYLMKEDVTYQEINYTDTDEKKFRIGFCVTGSFCTFKRIVPVIKNLVDLGHTVYPILSPSVANTDTRFGKAADFIKTLEEVTGNEPMLDISRVEPIGPKKMLDVLVVAPCTGNTLAKMANGIADTSVTLAVKSHLRNNRPVVVAVSTNDGLGANAQNIGKLVARKHIYMVPFRQDDCIEKENSLVADFDMTKPTIDAAMHGKQIEPLLV